ncbi:hypothetical protein SDC9_174205 [bioreactor metagenome]|uniref:Uncharacterized protein n=1 Tax=bioreactor metagenome TaxID=1076179 RepID=A0A645GKV8_9ZZZZ
MITSTSSEIPSPLLADIGTTGIPKWSDSFFTSIELPLAFTSSIMLRAITMGIDNSMSCSVKYRFLSMFVASTILSIKSGCSLRRKSRVTTSSIVYGDNE